MTDNEDAVSNPVAAVGNKVLWIKKMMIKDVDYGIIKGCGTKPVLLKPGAEKLLIAFNIYAKVDNIDIIDLEGLNREYRVMVSLISRKDVLSIGYGIGSATTLERKFKRDNPNPPDLWNTVLKMAKKRALVDAVLTSLGASMLFTQDLIETEREVNYDKE